MKPPPPPPVWINGAPRSMRSTIAAVEGLATPPVPTQGAATHRLPDGDSIALGFATGYAAGILTAVAGIAAGWVMVG